MQPRRRHGQGPAGDDRHGRASSSRRAPRRTSRSTTSSGPASSSPRLRVSAGSPTSTRASRSISTASPVPRWSRRWCRRASRWRPSLRVTSSKMRSSASSASTPSATSGRAPDAAPHPHRDLEADPPPAHLGRAGVRRRGPDHHHGGPQAEPARSLGAGRRRPLLLSRDPDGTRRSRRRAPAHERVLPRGRHLHVRRRRDRQ